MARETLNEDLNIEVDDTEEGAEEKKRRGGLTAGSFYDALSALLQAQAKIVDKSEVALPPTVLIAEVDGQLVVHLCQGGIGDIIFTTAGCGVGEDVDDAFTSLIEKVQKSVEDKRKAKFSDIDELMKKGGGVLRRVKSKKREAG